jgi:hypothetical protein
MFWPPAWTLGVRGGPKQGLESIYSRNHETRKFFYKTKVVGKVCFSGGRSYFWAHNPDLKGPGPHVLLEPWSIIFRQILINKRCSTPFPVVTLVRSRPPRPSLDPKPGVGGPKQGLESIYSLSCESRQNVYNTKVVGKICFSGGGLYIWAHNLDLEGRGPHVLLEPWSSTFRQSLLHKSCSVPSQ